MKSLRDSPKSLPLLRFRLWRGAGTPPKWIAQPLQSRLAVWPYGFAGLPIQIAGCPGLSRGRRACRRPVNEPAREVPANPHVRSTTAIRIRCVSKVSMPPSGKTGHHQGHHSPSLSLLVALPHPTHGIKTSTPQTERADPKPPPPARLLRDALPASRCRIGRIEGYFAPVGAAVERVVAPRHRGGSRQCDYSLLSRSLRQRSRWFLPRLPDTGRTPPPPRRTPRPQTVAKGGTTVARIPNFARSWKPWSSALTSAPTPGTRRHGNALTC